MPMQRCIQALVHNSSLWGTKKPKRKQALERKSYLFPGWSHPNNPSLASEQKDISRRQEMGNGGRAEGDNENKKI